SASTCSPCPTTPPSSPATTPTPPSASSAPRTRSSRAPAPSSASTNARGPTTASNNRTGPAYAGPVRWCSNLRGLAEEQRPEDHGDDRHQLQQDVERRAGGVLERVTH